MCCILGSIITILEQQLTVKDKQLENKDLQIAQSFGSATWYSVCKAFR